MLCSRPAGYRLLKDDQAAIDGNELSLRLRARSVAIPGLNGDVANVSGLAAATRVIRVDVNLDIHFVVTKQERAPGIVARPADELAAVDE